MTAENGGRDRHLRAAERKDRRAHRPETPRPELEADEEQEKNDAEFGDLEDFARLSCRENAGNAVGTQRHAGRQIAKHGADAEPAGKRRRNRHGGKQNRDIAQTHMRHSRLTPS